MMDKRKGSTFGRIDFYTQLKYLVAFLQAGSLDEPCIVNTPELGKVSFTDCNHCPFVLYESEMRFSVSRLYLVAIYGSNPYRPFVLRSSLTGNLFWTISPRLRLGMRCKVLRTRLQRDSLNVVIRLFNTHVCFENYQQLLFLFSLRVWSGRSSATTSSRSKWNSTEGSNTIVSIYLSFSKIEGKSARCLA